jgi:fatty-acyl-CoA synthase
VIFGVIRAGAIVTPLNVRYTAHELAEIIDDTGAELVFAQSDVRARLAPLATRVEDLASLEPLRHEAGALPERSLDPDAPVVIIATSGSTAKPKGVVFSHRSMLDYVAEFAIGEAACPRGSRVIAPAPLSTSAGFVQLIHYSVLGCTLFFEPVFDAERFLRVIEAERINAFGAVPVFFERIAQCPGFDAADLSNLAIATVGGAPVTRELQERWASKGVVLRQIYGQTEAGGNATIMPASLAPKFPEKCGRGGAFTELRIVDEQGRTCAAGEVGQILVRGPGRMVGYWNNPEATAAAIRDGWLYTGDLGVLDEDGLLTFVDRIKDIIISGGLNISAAEVERAVNAFDGVVESVVIAAKDPRFGETPLAIVYAPKPIDVAALIRHCNERLADYKVPRYVAVEPDPLPRLATGKLSKPALRTKYADAASMLPRVR